MYENKYPEVDDVVMVQVKSIAEMGAYVALLEYNGIEGMILLSELSRRRIRSITKLIKVFSLRGKLSGARITSCETHSGLALQVGRQEPVMVLRVDKEKGYIDLSKRRVAAEDIQVRRARALSDYKPCISSSCLLLPFTHSLVSAQMHSLCRMQVHKSLPILQHLVLFNL